MTVSPSHVSRETGPRAGDTDDLCVVAACHTFLCAVPTLSIHRLILPDNVDHVSFEARSTAARLGMITVSGEPYAAWDLGALLSMGPLEAAWILMTVQHAGNHVPIALRTGPCIAVQELAAHPLPAVFRARSAAFAGAFSARAARGRAQSLVFGLRLDPRALFGHHELAESLDAVASARAQTRGAHA